MYVAMLSALAAALVSAQTGSSCVLTQQKIQTDVMECLVGEPSILLEAMEHLKDPQSMVTVDFICRNQKATVGILLCMEKKLASCYQAVEQVINQYLPTREHLTKALQFMCEHKEDLMEKSCMDQGQAQEFMQCYLGQVQNTLSALRSDHNIKTAVCSVIHSEEMCLKQYRGKCSDTYVNLVIQLLDLLFPYCPVLEIDMDSQANNAMGSVLVRGRPLMFQPQGEVKYNVVNG
ncbi:hypothetical protein BsWGS_18668 [Bradybaena similaris]